MNFTATLLAQIATFAVLVWFVQRFLWGPMTNLMEERKKRIADGLAAAESGHRDKELAQKKAKEIIQEAKAQATDIIAHAEKRAGEIVEEAKDDARAEGDRLLVAARAEMDQAMNQAKDGLRRQVVELSLKGAQQVLMREVNAAEHNRALEKLAAGL